MRSAVRWDDFDFSGFVALALEVSSRAGESAASVKIKMAALGRLQQWDETIHEARAALEQIRVDVGAPNWR